MNTTQFHTKIDELLLQLEEALDEIMEPDIDYENHSGILTLDFDNGTKIIINRQEPVHQLWLATRKNGYHFDYVDGDWRDDRTGELFMGILEAACTEQAGMQVKLS